MTQSTQHDRLPNEMHAQLIRHCWEYVKDTLAADSSGHDHWHIYRVWSVAKTIAAEYEEADLLVVELAALLHDIADWKDNTGDFEIGPNVAAQWMNRSEYITDDQKEKVKHIIRHMSFKGAAAEQVNLPLEGLIVQDADRLDAIGAIGIARTFAFGGSRGNRMHEPGSLPMDGADQTAYVDNTDKGTTINHFYEKLLLLKDRMNTEVAKRLAEERHQVMEDFLVQFYAEWDGHK